MIDVNELRKGVTFELDGGLFKVVDYSHNKTGRGNANIRIKARNLLTGANIERTFNSGLSVQDVRLDFHNVSYLYATLISITSWMVKHLNSRDQGGRPGR
jgi:elongation factor P